MIGRPKKRRKMRWSDLSRRRRFVLVGAGGAQVSLLVAALADLRRRPSTQLRGSKAMWTMLSFLNFVGPLAYFAFGRRR